MCSFAQKPACAGSLLNDGKIDRHSHPNGSKQACQNYGVQGNSARHPTAGTQFVNNLNVPYDGTDVDDYSQQDDCYSRPDGNARGSHRDMGIVCLNFPQEQPESGHCETYTHLIPKQRHDGKSKSARRMLPSAPKTALAGNLLEGFFFGYAAMEEAAGG